MRKFLNVIENLGSYYFYFRNICMYGVVSI